MKVLHLTTHVNTGGITRYILKLIRPLSALGVETQVFSGGGDLTGMLQTEGAGTHEAAVRTKSELSPKIYLALPKLVRLIRQEKIEVLHAHTRITQVMAYWAGKLTGVPVVTTCHGYFRRRLGRRLLPAWGDRTIAISLPVEEMLQNEFHLNPARIRTVPNGVDIGEIDAVLQGLETNALKKSFGFGERDRVIGIISRLVREKGHEYLIRAFLRLLGEFPDLRLLIVGDGKTRGALESLVRECGIAERVHFTGDLKNVIEPLAVMDVFAFPVIWREGFGLSLVEAMACRRPVAASKIGALDTIIHHEINGLLVPVKDIDGLAGAIKRLLTDPGLVKGLTERGRAMVEKQFTLERMARDIADVYHEAVALRRGHSG